MGPPAGAERRLRISFVICGILAGISLAWGASAGFPGPLLLAVPAGVGIFVALLGLESSERDLRARLDRLERAERERRASEPAAPAPPLRGYDPGSQRRPGA